MPYISVVIPCYNQGCFVIESINSVEKQKRNDVEVIIVNDGSSDQETNNLLGSYENPICRIITTCNQGLAAARNNGIREARGKYILPLDADDRIGPGYLEQAVALLEAQSDLGIVYCQARLFGAVDAHWDLPDFSLEQMLLDNCIFCSAFFRKSDWEKVGGYDETLRHGWEDYDFWLSLIELGRQVYRIPEVFFYYRVSQDSMVRARPRQHKVETFTRIFHKHQALFINHIEVWVDKLIDARESYQEASLLVDGADDPTRIRKVGPGPCRLVFTLPSDQWHELFLRPAAGAVSVRVNDVRLRIGQGLELAATWQVDGALAQEQIFHFAAGKGGIRFSFLESPEHCTDCQLLVDLEYLAFGAGCLALLVKANEPASESGEGQQRLLSPSPEASGDMMMRQAVLPAKRERVTWKQRLKSWWCYLTRKQYRIIARSGLFDPRFYRSRDPQLDALGMEPLLHYVEHGWYEGRNPNGLFDAAWYVDRYPEAKGNDPLLHYLVMDGRCHTNPLFWGEYYAVSHPESSKSGMTPLAHYLQKGWKEGCNPNPLFDSSYYCAVNGGNMPDGMNPLEHYLDGGYLAPFHPFFDTAYYIEDNPALAQGNFLLLLHYLDYGAAEGRSPNRFFDPGYYRERYGIPSEPAWQGFVDFVIRSNTEMPRPGALFDPAFYAGCYPGYVKTHAHPLLHYQEAGVIEGNYPCAEVAELSEKPLISIITPVYDTDERLLRRCIHSVLYQAYPHWELCLVDDASSKPHIRPLLEEYAARDRRIRIQFLERNQGIAGASNHGAAVAQGDYLGFLDHDDELSLDALYQVVRRINEDGAEVLYSDEDLINLESRHLDTFYKPGYNPTLLLGHNYITHFLVTRRSLFDVCGGFAAGCSGAQDYDLILKLTEQGARIAHIARVLYHWRAHQGSTSINHGEKHYADRAGRLALQNALRRRNIIGQVESTDLNFFYRIRRDIQADLSVSILVLPGGDGAALHQGLGIIGASGLARCREVIAPWVEEMESFRGIPFRFLPPLAEESPSAWLNRASHEAGGSHLLLFDPYFLPTSGQGLSALLEFAQLPESGMVAGRIDYPESAGLHSGSIPDLDRREWEYWLSFVRDVSLHHNGMHCAQNVLAVAEHLTMIGKSVLLEAGGYDPSLRTLPLAQLDLCLRLHAGGWQNIHTPYWQASPSAKWPGYGASDRARAEAEKTALQERWRDLFVKGDLYYNNQILQDNHIGQDAFVRWHAGLQPQNHPENRIPA